MNKSEIVEKYINDIFRKAVLRREEIKRTYIVLDSILYNYGMETYINIAKQRIMDMEGVEILLNQEHINYSILDDVMELDEVAFLCCQDIIKGYVKESLCESCLELIRAKDELVQLNNDMIKFYRDKSLIVAIREYLKYKTMKPANEEQKGLLQVVLECYKLELTSRLPLVKLYYKVYYWSCKKAATVLAYKISKKLKLEESN